MIEIKSDQKETRKKVSLHTLGCRLNISETGHIAEGFAKRGYEIVEFGEASDVTFLNTCTVTDKADSTCRNIIRKAKRNSPGGKVVVAGCYAQMSPDELSSMREVDLVLGTNEKFKVFDYLDEEDEINVKIDNTNEFFEAKTGQVDSHTRAFLKIQDGCNYICSYCIIPFARGRSRVMGVDEIVKSAKDLTEKGFKEIILTGVNIGEYEAKSGEKLSLLLRKLLEIDKLKRLRLSSVEPNTITDDLLSVLKDSPKFMNHFHIPLQSGDDDILKKMRRKYTIGQYDEILEKIKKNFPHCGIGADTIVGFPGETVEQFNNTKSFLKSSPITHFHIFPFSSRKGTMAAKMEGHLPFAVKKERVSSLNQLGEEKLNDFAKTMLGKTTPVLFESQVKNGMREGLTPNYIRVKAQQKNIEANEIREVRITEFLGKGTLKGELNNNLSPL